MKKIITAEDLEQLLRNRFCPPAWAFIPQVRNGTGFLKITRTADAIAIGLWPSRGLYLYGFEIKISRSDWLNELRQPDKAEEIAQFCDFFYIVAPKDIVKIDEVPQNWGLMIPFGATTKVIKEAKQLKAIPVDKLFLAAILRRTQEIIVPEVKLKEQYKKGIEEGERRSRQDFKYQQEKYEDLKKMIAEFEQKSGVHINEWNFGNIGEAVRMVLNGEHLRAKEELQNLLTKARAIVKDIEDKLL